MGVVTFVRRDNGAEQVQVEFPLDREFVTAMAPFNAAPGIRMGAGTLIPRVDFDRDYVQVVPLLPVAHLNEDPPAHTERYQAPELSLLPPSYELLYRTMRRMEETIERLEQKVIDLLAK